MVGGESTGALLALYLASEHPEIAATLAYAPALKLKLGTRQTTLIRVLAPFVPYIRKQEMGDDPFWQGYTVYPLKGARELLRLQRQVHRRLTQISQPVLIVQGRLDATVAPSAAEIFTVKSVRRPRNCTGCPTRSIASSSTASASR